MSRFLEQLNLRFSEKNQELLKIFEIFDHSSPNFFNSECTYLHNFINHYNYFEINTSKILSEFPSAKSLIQTNLKKSITSEKNIQLDIDNIISSLSQLPTAFSETLKIISLIKTLPITTASNERFFSSLKSVKNYLRTTMGDQRLSDLMVISVEKEEANDINLNEAVDIFANMKSRRYPLK